MTRVIVKVGVPSMLSGATEGRREVEVEASTLSECLERLVEQYPLLDVHLYDEQRRVRQHVHLFYNDQNTQWLDSLDLELEAGDTLTILQAVSGG